MRKHILFIALICFAGTLTAQSYNSFIGAADEAFAGKDYFTSMTYYMEAAGFEKGGLGLDYKIAESARQIKSFETALNYYKKVMEGDANNAFPLATFWMADIHQQMGHYEEAKTLYNMYLSENNGDDPYYSAKAQKEIQASDWAMALLQEYEDSEEVEIRHLGKEVNTRYSEFGALKRGESLYYSSLRFTDKADDHNPKRPLSYILNSQNGERGKRLKKDFGQKGRHVAHTTFNDANTHIIYTMCDYVDVNDIQCKLYVRHKLDDGKWSEPDKLREPMNREGTTSTQPAFGKNPATGQEVLYFVSDRDGGKGGLDIWYATVNGDGSFGEPIALSEVNTNEDDISPYYHMPTNTLYFSSRGYQGMGGFDVYMVDGDSGAWGGVEHMGAQVNSSYDDVYYSLNEDGTMGYMSSNREGSAYLDKKNKACCFDIYELKYNDLEIKLLAETFNKETLEALQGATVTLYNLDDPNAEPIVITNADANDFNFDLQKDTHYRLVAEKPGYKPDEIEFNTLGIKKSTTIQKKLHLQPDFLTLNALTFDKSTSAALKCATVRLVDLTDPSAPPQVSNNCDGNEFNFKLMRGHAYQLTATRDGYKSTTISLDTKNYEGETLIVKKLYLTKESLIKYLPLKLYFDNDRPDRRTVKTRTTKTYTQTYNRYYPRKGLFERMNSGNDRTAIGDFFEYRVKKGKQDLDMFLQELASVLRAGQRVHITIKGFASPLAPTNYNEHLSRRRVSSVINELSSYAGGSLKSYIDSGMLTVGEAYFGETTAPGHVSSSNTNVKKSIYSVEASEERRVEIIGVDQN